MVYLFIIYLFVPYFLLPDFFFIRTAVSSFPWTVTVQQREEWIVTIMELCWVKRPFQIITYFRLVTIPLERLSIDLPCRSPLPTLPSSSNAPTTQSTLNQSGAKGNKSGFGAPLFFPRHLFVALFLRLLQSNFISLFTGCMFSCACRASNTLFPMLVEAVTGFPW